MKRCYNCWTDNNDDAKYCRHCGRSFFWQRFINYLYLGLLFLEMYLLNKIMKDNIEKAIAKKYQKQRKKELGY